MPEKGCPQAGRKPIPQAEKTGRRGEGLAREGQVPSEEFETGDLDLTGTSFPLWDGETGTAGRDSGPCQTRPLLSRPGAL